MTDLKSALSRFSMYGSDGGSGVAAGGLMECSALRRICLEFELRRQVPDYAPVVSPAGGGW